MTYNQTTGPTSEPVTLAEAKIHLRVDHTLDNDLIDNLIVSARQMVENYCDISLFTQTWDYYTDAIPVDKVIYLFKSPVASVTHLKYYDGDNAEQTLSTDYYNTDLTSNPARIEFTEPPTIYNRTNAVNIQFVAGFPSTASIPAAIKAAVLLALGHLYENRGDQGLRTIPKAFYQLINPYKIRRF